MCSCRKKKANAAKAAEEARQKQIEAAKTQETSTEGGTEIETKVNGTI